MVAIMNTSKFKVHILIPLAVILLLGATVITFYSDEEQQYAPVRDNAQYQDPELLSKAWELPVAAQFKDSFEYQNWMTFCGPASAVNVFRSEGIDSYSQSNLFDSSNVSYWKVKILGMTLDEMADLVKENSNWQVEPVRGATLDEFRDLIRQSNNPSQRYIINFNRLPLFGVDIGHHSPIGGYLENEDLVFVLDVHEDYKPFLVSTEMLYSAMNTTDSEINKLRGLLVIKPK